MSLSFEVFQSNLHSQQTKERNAMINNHLIMDCMEMQQLKARYDEAKEKEN